MSVRVRILLVLAVVFAAFGGSNYWIQQSILLPKFTELEREKASSLIESCKEAVLREVEALATTAHDWSAWDLMYQFAADHDMRFITENMSVSNLENARVDIMIVSGLRQDLIFKLIRPQAASRISALDAAVPAIMAAVRPPLDSERAEPNSRGVYMTQAGPLFVAAQPITNNEGEAPSRGVLILGRFFTPELAKSLSQQTQVPFEYYDLANGSVSSEEQSAIAWIGGSKNADVWEIDDHQLRVSSLLQDVGGEPALLLTANLARDITERGREAVRYSQFSGLAAGILFLIAILFALERVVLARLGNLSSSVGQIGHDGLGAASIERVNIEADGPDEVGRLGRDINQMLARLTEADQSLRKSESRFRALTELAPVGIFQTDAHGSYTFVNERWQSITGCPAADAMGQRWMVALHPEDLQTVVLAWNEMVKTAGELKLEYRYRKPLGEIVWVAAQAVSVRDGAGAAVGFIGTVTDVSALKGIEARLQHLALYDSLTGLPNRVLLLDRLEKALSRTRRRPPFVFAVLVVDLDGFKQVNDNFGHKAGDQVLTNVSSRINAALRPGDTAARMGGDEFTILLLDLPDTQVVELICRRLIERINQPISLGETSVTVGASVGIVLSTQGHANPDDLLRDADAAMYQAKVAGKNQYRVYASDTAIATNTADTANPNPAEISNVAVRRGSG